MVGIASKSTQVVKITQHQVPFRLWPRVQFKIRDVSEIGQDTSLQTLSKRSNGLPGAKQHEPQGKFHLQSVCTAGTREKCDSTISMWLAQAEADGFDVSQPAALTGAENLLDTGTIVCFRFGESPQTFQSSKIKLSRAPGDRGFN